MTRHSSLLVTILVVGLVIVLIVGLVNGVDADLNMLHRAI